MSGSWWLRTTVLLLSLGYLAGSPGLLVLAALTSVGVGAAWIWNRLSLQGVSYQRRLDHSRGFPGEQVRCWLRVENRKRLPLPWLRIVDRWPLEIAPEDKSLLSPSHLSGFGNLHLVLSMHPRQSVRREIQLALRRRGVHLLGPAWMSSGDGFGLFQSESLHSHKDQLVVFPRVTRLADLGIRPEDPFGLRHSPRRLYEDTAQPCGVRDYRPEDGFRRIHWPASARASRLQSRVFQPVAGLDLILFLNAATYAQAWMGVDKEQLDRLVETAASFVYAAFEQGYRVGLVSNGSVARSGRPFRFPPSRAPGQLPKLLEALAGLTYLIPTPFDRFLLRETPFLEYGASLVVISAVLSPETLEAIARLRRRARKLTLVSLTADPVPRLRGIDVLHLPSGIPQPLAT
ncbi:MAG: DUF58 domain-containing protein [Anaerolineales bacterium]|nr:DUF58 domain-containing protein [Anaerolineales bacterium]